MQNPLGLTNLPLNLRNLIYSANIGELGFKGLEDLGNLKFNNFIILQSPAQSAINVLNLIL